MGCHKGAVFGGKKNFFFTFLHNEPSVIECPGALSNNSSTLNAILLSLQCFSTAGQKYLENPSLNTAWVTHVFSSDCQIIGSDQLL
jgi:hypothetical protein